MSGLRVPLQRLPLWAVLFVASLGLLVSRRPDLLTQPHFYAEDGQLFFAGAHNLPAWQTVLTPVAGYLLVFQRLVALAFTPLGLSHAAIAFALVALAIQVLPPLFFASSRFRSIIPDDRVRYGVAAIYLLLSNAELTGSLTNSQWHLAVLAFLVLIAAPPRTRAGRVFDVSVLLISGLTGPYALLLLPLALLFNRKHLGVWQRVEVGVLAAVALVQLGFVVAGLHAGARSNAPLGASAENLVFIIANQTLGRFAGGYLPYTALVAAVALAAGIVILLTTGARNGPRSLRYFIGFAVALAASGLIVPYGAVTPGATVWYTMAYGVWGMRYFFLIPIALVLSALVLTRRRGVTSRSRPVWAAVIVGAVLISASTQWEYASVPAQHLDQYQALLDAAPAGNVVAIPIEPTGWVMRVVAR